MDFIIILKIIEFYSFSWNLLICRPRVHEFKTSGILKLIIAVCNKYDKKNKNFQIVIKKIDIFPEQKGHLKKKEE